MRSQATSKFAVFEMHGETSDDDRDDDDDDYSDIRKVLSCSQRDLMERIVPTAAYNDTCNLSKLERRQLPNKGDVTLTYGEVLCDSFREIMINIFESHDGLKEGSIFYDLGSGRGRATFMAPLLADEYYNSTNFLAASIGIEVMDCLYEASLNCLKEWELICNQDSCDSANGPQTLLQFFHGSFTDLQVRDWTDGDLVFVNSTCFSASLMKDISSIAKAMKIGSIFVSFTHMLCEETTGFALLQEARYEMSWGFADVFIHKKVL